MGHLFNRSTWGGLVLAASLASPSFAQVLPPPSVNRATPPEVKKDESAEKREIEAFFEAMDECGQRNVALLDDRISSADIVANGLMAFCLREGHYKKLDALYKSDSLAIRMRDTYFSRARSDALVIVLMHRAKLLPRTQ